MGSPLTNTVASPPRRPLPFSPSHSLPSSPPPHGRVAASRIEPTVQTNELEPFLQNFFDAQTAALRAAVAGTATDTRDAAGTRPRDLESLWPGPYSEADHGNLNHWLHKMEAAADAQEMSDKILIQMACSRLDGDHQALLERRGCTTWREAKKLLLATRSTASAISAAQRNLKARNRQPNEGLEEYARALEWLVAQACPQEDAFVQGRYVLLSFLSGISEGLSQKIVDRGCNTLDAAIEVARKYDGRPGFGPTSDTGMSELRQEMEGTLKACQDELGNMRAYARKQPQSPSSAKAPPKKAKHPPAKVRQLGAQDRPIEPEPEPPAVCPSPRQPPAEGSKPLALQAARPTYQGRHREHPYPQHPQQPRQPYNQHRGSHYQPASAPRMQQVKHPQQGYPQRHNPAPQARNAQQPFRPRGSPQDSPRTMGRQLALPAPAPVSGSRQAAISLTGTGAWNRPPRDDVCWSCGLPGHLQRHCRAHSVTICYECGQPGHYRTDCPSLNYRR